jgi:hypothetical protein
MVFLSSSDNVSFELNDGLLNKRWSVEAPGVTQRFAEE